MQPVVILLIAGSAMFIMIGGLSLLSHYYTLNGIKSRTVGDGQYGTARFATQKEIAETYESILYEPERWRKGEHLPTAQGMILGSVEKAGKLYALVDTGDVHCLMIGAAGVGKTAHFLYPNIEYACASEMSFLTTDTKGDLYRNYAGIAQKYYGYQTAVIDLRNPTRSDGDNMLHLVNKYMDVYLADPTNLSAKAKAEKYAKITAKTIISSQGADSSSYGQNAFFYDAAEGILTAAILLIAEFCPEGKRHIISVFKLIQDLLAPSKVKGKNQFQLLMAKLPDTHKAKWFAGAALNTAEQSMERVDDMNKLREKNAVYLDRLLSDIDGVIPQKRSKGTTIFTHYMYMFYFDSSKFNGMTRNEFVEVLRAEGIPANIAFPVVSDTKLFREQNFDRRIDNYKCNADLSFARKIANEVICMPHCVLEGDESDLEDIRGAILKIQKEIY